MKKLFNYRPLLSIFLFLIAGIIFVVGLYASTFYIVLSVLVALAFLVTFFIKLFTAKKHKLFKLLSIVLAFAFGCGISLINIEVYNSRPKVDGNCFVSGRVCERPFYSNGDKVVVTIDNAAIVKQDSLEKYEPKGKIRFYLTADDNRGAGLELGDEIGVDAQLINAKLFNDGEPNFSFFTNGIYILGFANENDLVNLDKSSPTLIDQFKLKVKRVLDENLSGDYSELAYTMLFGDRAGLSDELETNYSSSGVGHLLAVSGLHVGFLVLLLSFILSLFKANDKVKFVIISIVIFIYALICGFTISVTRALIMTIILLFMRMIRSDYDGLSSLSVAGIIILLFNPLQLFTNGFKLSFSSVAAIMMFSRPIEIFFGKFLHRKIASAFALSISATIGVTPFILTAFEKLSIFSILTNFLAIPIASFAYMILVPSVLLGLIYIKLGFIAKIFELLMRVVTGITQIMGAISIAGANKILISCFSMSFIASAIVCSDYLFIKKKSKIITSSVLLGVSIVFFAVSFL